ncbi:MAG: hypothetical protein RLZZ92_692 [Actinomycetota bacterium]
MTLSVALPNKGALAEDATQIFREAGYRLRNDSKELSFLDSVNDVILRPMSPPVRSIWESPVAIYFLIAVRVLMRNWNLTLGIANSGWQLQLNN